MLKSGSNTSISVKEVSSIKSVQGQLDLLTTFLIKITIFFNLIFLTINYFSRAFPIILNVGTLCFAIGLYFLYKSKSKYNKYLNAILFFFYLVWISFYACICALDTYMIIYFVVLIVFCVLLFENDKVRAKMALLTSTVLLIILFIKPHLPLLISYDNPYRAYLHIIFTLAVVYYAIKKYANIAEKETLEKDKLVAEVNDKNIELERFAYITSHDLKQPIRNIISFAGLLERNVNSKNIKEKNLDYIDFIKKSSSNMESLITDILSLSKIGSQKIDNEEVDLNEVIQSSQESLKFLILDKNADVTICELPVIKGNELYLKLLFQNLIENAIKYNVSDIPKVDIRYSSDVSYHVIYVQDNGLGIDEKFYNIVFQPFQRLHSNREYQGSGLGLSICKKIVERHEGKIELDSWKEKGSLFTLRFPKN